jgi:putative transposase
VLYFSFQIQQKALSRLRWLSTFTDVFIYDASPIRLPTSLSDKFPGNRNNHSPACLKFSALYQMSIRGIKWLKLTPQKIHDSQILPDLEQLKGSLFLFDLGYFSHLFLYQLNEAEVWFVCRLKANSAPIITRIGKGVAKRHIGRPLNKQVNLRGAIVEVWAKLMLPGKGFIEVRLIGFRFPKTKQYRWYATNLPHTTFLAQWIYPIYRLRWQIELFFKSIKSILNADQITSGNENIALAIVYSSILSSLISSSIIIEEALVFAHVELKSITAQRLMHVFSLFAHNLAQCLISKEFSNISLRNKLLCLLPLLTCPNIKHRPTSLEVVVMLTL